MPIIARFFSILVKMYYIEDEHNPPHIHAKYNEFEGIFNISTGTMTRGNLPKNATRLVKEFIAHIGKGCFRCGRIRILKS